MTSYETEDLERVSGRRPSSRHRTAASAVHARVPDLATAGLSYLVVGESALPALAEVVSAL